MSASGKRLAPFVVYKGKNLYSSWTAGGPEGTTFSVNESGWMESRNFLSWFNKAFIPAVEKILQTGPVVLFFDGHHSHLSVNLLKTAKDRNIHLVCIPAHTSHILQPLDVGVYGPMKSAWHRILKSHKMVTRATNVTKQVFPALLQQLWASSVAGLYPLDANNIPTYKLAPSLPITVEHDFMPTTSSAVTVATIENVKCPKKYIRMEGMYFQMLMRTAEDAGIWSFLLDGQMGTLKCWSEPQFPKKSLRDGGVP